MKQAGKVFAMLLFIGVIGCNNYKVRSFDQVRREGGGELLILDMTTEEWDQESDKYVVASGGLLYMGADTTGDVMLKSLHFTDCDGNIIFECAGKRLEWRKSYDDSLVVSHDFDAKRVRWGNITANVVLELYDAGGPTNRVQMDGTIKATTQRVNSILYAH